ncbi:ribosome small subunit-dependent GTPase A [Bacillus solimangrovi]|uniref:Small ribosomal subunit biogenesis GTPase RsgA n=1 Tax=Bacillus solimangrovi TaxID=1305675 RepID=A0A1E5LJC7_9BACI|nr:ribosome small subunit-dependent GTPase A [Bacillus solimangrovi]OEH94184.1 ribosome small subunit-dependent GTPase A [Bacillus solimangrovi]
MYELNKLGFDVFFEEQVVDSSYEVGRIATLANGIYKILSKEGELQGQLSGKYYHEAELTRDFPCVGDWVLFTPLLDEGKGIIHQTLERKSLLSRQAAGEKTIEQLIAANVDTVFLVNALNKDFNVRRMERYLTQVYESGANPVFILTKKDLCDDVEEKISAVEEVAFGVPVIAVNTLQSDDLEVIRSFVETGKTISLIGSSGVGKSTLINGLLGEDIQRTQGIREDDAKGRHTTTHRELFMLQGGGVVIDTPGMRELQLWTDEEATDEAFQDIKELTLQCKFRDCRHGNEPGCAIKQAIEIGELSEERYRSYRKLQKEAKFLDRKEKYGVHRAARMQMQDLKNGIN